MIPDAIHFLRISSPRVSKGLISRARPLLTRATDTVSVSSSLGRREKPLLSYKLRQGRRAAEVQRLPRRPCPPRVSTD